MRPGLLRQRAHPTLDVCQNDVAVRLYDSIPVIFWEGHRMSIRTLVLALALASFGLATVVPTPADAIGINFDDKKKSSKKKKQSGSGSSTTSK